MKKCPFCKEGHLERKTIKETFRYKDHNIELAQPGEYCNSCDEGIITGHDLKVTEKALHDWRAEIDGFLSSDDVRKIRKKLGLTQHQAAKLFGGGANAFGRYENGQARQMRSTDNLLRLLDKHPHLLSEIRADDDETVAA